MSKTLKTIIWIAIIIVVAVVLWLWYGGMKSQNGASLYGSTNQNVNSGLSQGTSDASLNQDLSAIDNQLNGLASDTANADQSLNQSAGQ